MPRVFVDLLSYTGTKGGMETYTRELYRALGAMDGGWEYIGYVSREGAGLDLSWFPGRIIESGISGENRFVWAWGELTQVAKAAAREEADLIHAPATLVAVGGQIRIAKKAELSHRSIGACAAVAVSPRHTGAA